MTVQLACGISAAKVVLPGSFMLIFLLAEERLLLVDRVLQYLKQVAGQLKLAHKQDVAGNIVIYRPGSGGGEHAPPVVIQGHVDMVRLA